MSAEAGWWLGGYLGLGALQQFCYALLRNQ